MKTFLRVCGVSIAVVFFLSITISERPIFYYIYTTISPVTNSIQNFTESIFSRSFQSTTAYTKKLFNNSVPKVRDSINSKLSAATKAAPKESITAKEKQQLDELIKSHH